ncbi:MAG: Xaa-Pro peptidase family protein [Anaerolineaceae bacterium]
MRTNLDDLIRANGAIALWVSGAANHNPSMVYLTGGIHLTQGDLFYIPGQTPILFHGSMERDEAAKTGYRLISYSNYDPKAYLSAANGDRAEAMALRYQQMLEDIGLTQGKVLLYGSREVGRFYSLIKRLQELPTGLEFAGDVIDAVLLEARATKTPDELEHIRTMGHITTRVVANTLDLLTSQSVVQETLVKANGAPLTIGDVKAQINLWLSEFGAENPEDTIFAIGRDAGVPHSNGTDSDPIKLGQTIVYDIYPCEKGGGYFYDFTRTWCLGYAPEEVQKTYNDVSTTYDTIVSELKTGVNFNDFQVRTCELFESMGHETIRQNFKVENGYVHSLGHGVGLDVHEKPFCGLPEDSTQTLKPGSVITIEPGLYYPDKGYGIRLEDTYYIDESGAFHKFVDFPMDLIIPMKRG